MVHKTAKMMHALGNGKALSEEEFKKIKTPVLAAIGSEDAMVTKEETQYLSKILPQGEFMEIKGFKHPIEQVDFRELSEILQNYFSKAAINLSR